jgi:predicted SAM-dependent methyltransferase
MVSYEMPRKFQTIEVLPHEPPFSRTLVQELGLRGINCGSARALFPGWINTDRAHLRAWDETETEPGRLTLINDHLYYLEFDSTEPYPFEEASFEWAYSEHFIEHLTLEEVIDWLASVRRLLKPGGHARLSTPDLRLYVEGYLDSGNGFFAEHRERLSQLRAFADTGVPDRPAWMINQIFRRWKHKWIFDFDEVRYAAERAGFDPAAVTRRSFSEGAIPEMAALDSPGHNDESLYVELTRT